MKMGWHGSAWMGLAGLLLMLTPFAAASQCQSILSVAQKLGMTSQTLLTNCMWIVHFSWARYGSDPSSFAVSNARRQSRCGQPCGARERIYTAAVFRRLFRYVFGGFVCACIVVLIDACQRCRETASCRPSTNGQTPSSPWNTSSII